MPLDIDGKISCDDEEEVNRDSEPDHYLCLRFVSGLDCNLTCRIHAAE
jgi:hypothetical protein